MTRVQVPAWLLPSYQTFIAFPSTLQAAVMEKFLICCCHSEPEHSVWPPKGYATVREWMTQRRQCLDWKTRVFPTTPYMLIMFFHKRPLFCKFGLKIPVPSSLSLQCFLEGLYASCCLDNSTCLGLIWYWFKKRGGKPIAILQLTVKVT